nr:ankyrin repeat domain-containing protein 7 [Oryctolagus cuniculus]
MCTAALLGSGCTFRAERLQTAEPRCGTVVSQQLLGVFLCSRSASRLEDEDWWPSKESSVRCENGIEAQFGYRIRGKDLRKLHKAASKGDVARVQHLLLLKKSSVNDRDRKNRTALHLACADGHSEVVTLLLERKCVINVPDDDNMTPLMKAVQSARILLDHGAGANVIDDNGNTALHYAAYCENAGIAK